MKEIKIKETYLLFLIVIGLVSLSLYSTYALFTASTEITDVVSFSTSLTTDSSILEYEMITVPSGESKIIELNVTNSHTDTIYYGAWYQALTDASDVNIGIYTEKSSTPASGTIDAGSVITIVVGVANSGSSDAILNIGVVGSETSNLNLADTRTLITGEFITEVYVTQEYLDAHSIITTETINLEYTTPEMTEVTLTPGTYKLEVWGAQGGSYDETYYGGKGGYSYGTITLSENTTTYVYPGGSGSNNTTTSTPEGGGFNGGGHAITSSSTYSGSGGGGASDIRIGTDSLYARVIVAGGGGGSFGATTGRGIGGYGGGETGGEGGSSSSSYYGGTGGTQTAGGISYYGTSEATTTRGTLADFGVGGSRTETGSYGSGGGGGWYGGGFTRRAAGGGGSGYVYTSSTASNCPSGCLLTSTYYLTDAATIGGDQSFTDFDGTTVTGHAGDGAVRISGTGEVVAYTIPTLLGLDDMTISLGENVDLLDGVTLKCENGKTGCSLVGTDITDTSTLSLGTHTIYYTTKNSNNQKYIYARTINVIIYPSTLTLNKLGLSLGTGTPNFTNTSCSSGCGETTVGIYKAEDDLGTSYYFRGDVENNYVKFAGFYWRIIRINGDGTIRMVYDGTSAHANGTASSDRQVTTSAYNSTDTSSAHLGYMYGDVAGATYEATHANTTNSTIKTYLENTWYVNNILNAGYSSYVADAIYCNDREVSTADSSYAGDGSGSTEEDTLFKAYERNALNYTPSLKCNQLNDRFAVGDSIDGFEVNGDLTYPVGLITVDEIAFAGGVYDVDNALYYLYNGDNWWGMSAMRNYWSQSTISAVVASGALRMGTVSTTSGGVRPVISLSSDLTYTGTGSMTDPFVPVLN